MNHLRAQKNKLIELLNTNEIKSFTLLGTPSEEMQQVLSYNESFPRLLSEKNYLKTYFGVSDAKMIPIEFKHPSFDDKDVFALIVHKKITSKILDQIIRDFFLDVDYIIQTAVSDAFVSKIYNKDRSALFIGDYFEAIGGTQQSIANKIHRSKQIISDIRNKRASVGIDTLVLLMHHYPLMPWDALLHNYGERENAKCEYTRKISVEEKLRAQEKIALSAR